MKITTKFNKGDNCWFFFDGEPMSAFVAGHLINTFENTIENIFAEVDDFQENITIDETECYATLEDMQIDIFANLQNVFKKANGENAEANN